MNPTAHHAQTLTPVGQPLSIGQDASQSFKVRKSKLSMAMGIGVTGQSDDTHAASENDSRSHSSLYNASVLADLKAATPSSSASLNPLDNRTKDDDGRKPIEVSQDPRTRFRSAKHHPSDFISLSSDATVPPGDRHSSEDLEEEAVPLSTQAARARENEQGQKMRKAFADAQIASEEEASEADETSLPHQRWDDTQLAKWQTVREVDAGDSVRFVLMAFIRGLEFV